MTTHVSTNFGWPSNGVNPSAAQIQEMQTRLVSAFTSVGLVQTSDTGQRLVTDTNWGSVNVDVGYFVFRFDDAAQSTDPIFIRVTVGRGGATAFLRLGVTVGQGTNGAGTITGTNTGHYYLDSSSAHNGSTTLQAYSCYKDGAFTLMFGCGWSTSRVAQSGLAIERSRDSDGTYNALGVSALFGWNGFWRSRALRWANNVTTGPGVNFSFCLVPGLPADTALLNGDKQLYPHLYSYPDVRQRWSSFTVRNSEFALNPTTFTARPFNNELRTFIHMGTAGAGAMAANATDDVNFGPCFLWE